MVIVSVPYRGYSFFNSCYVKELEDYGKFPSLTGVIRFLIFGSAKDIEKEYEQLFPSLTGVIRFLILPSKARMATGLKTRFAGQNYF